MAAKSATGRILNASISKIVQNVLIYMCANFGAFRTIWTIGLLCRWTISVSCNTWLKSCRKIESHSIYVSAKIHFDTFYSKQDTAVGIFHVRKNHFLTNQMFFDYPVASFSSTHSKTRQSDVIGCREHRIRDYGSISTLLTKLLKTLTLRYRCRYLPCTEQSVFDKSDVFRSSCRWFCINTFENTPFGCNLMPQTR